MRSYENELYRRRRLGEIGLRLGSQETLDSYVTKTWAPTHGVTLAPATAKGSDLYDKHISPYLGHLKLIEITPDAIARWQADRLKAGAGRVSIFKAHTVLGSILERAFEASGSRTTPRGSSARSAGRPRRRSGRWRR